MITCYIRSSSANTYKQCAQSYFINYVLGIPQPPNVKTVKGSIVHKVFENLALSKLAKQNGTKSWIDDQLGEVFINECDPEELLDRVLMEERKKGEFNLGKADRRDCWEWISNTLSMYEGRYDPRNLDIIAVEMPFDIPMDFSWAKYSWDIGGYKIEGELHLKGVIDLIVQSGIPNVIATLDWKTGSRVAWGEPDTPVKDMDRLYHDFQLRLYRYCTRKLFPDVDDILVDIFYCRDTQMGGYGGRKKEIFPGGIFHVPITDENLDETEQQIKEMFLKIVNTIKPPLSKSWFCERLCHYGKTKSPHSPNETICAFFERKVREDGIDSVTAQYGDLSLINHYSEGGGKIYSKEEK